MMWPLFVLRESLFPHPLYYASCSAICWLYTHQVHSRRQCAWQCHDVYSVSTHGLCPQCPAHRIAHENLNSLPTGQRKMKHRLMAAWIGRNDSRGFVFKLLNSCCLGG